MFKYLCLNHLTHTLKSILAQSNRASALSAFAFLNAQSVGYLFKEPGLLKMNSHYDDSFHKKGKKVVDYVKAF